MDWWNNPTTYTNGDAAEPMSISEMADMVRFERMRATPLVRWATTIPGLLPDSKVMRMVMQDGSVLLSGTAATYDDLWKRAGCPERREFLEALADLIEMQQAPDGPNR